MAAAERNPESSGVMERDQRGNVIGKYRLVAELGRGGMAEVFLALVHGVAGFSKLMVIKRLRPHLADEHEFLQMFLDEARLAAKLSHPNIVQTIEVGEENGQFFISMEYLEGQPLNRILRRCGDRVTMAMALRILCDSLAGLHHAHNLTDYDGTRLNVVHRDATPHNIFVTYNGQTKVVDFGIAKAAISVAETRTGVLKGKVSYMAPEQARGEEVDRRADVFSIGCCIWEVLTGKRVWKGKSDIQVLNAIMANEDAIPSPRTVKPDIPEGLERICMKALAFDPERRHQSALELKQEIEDYLNGIGDKTTVAMASAIIAERFQSERAKLRSLIDQQVKSVSMLPTGEWDKVNIPRLPATPASLASMSGDESGSTDLHTPATSSIKDNPALVTSPSYTPVGPVAPGSKLPAVVAASIVIAGIVAVIVFANGNDAETTKSAVTQPAPAQETKPAPVTTEVVEKPDPAATEIELSVSVSPSKAEITIDGEPVANPFKGSFPKDDQSHKLVVSAKGYQTVEREVDFKTNRALDLVLEKEKPVAVARPRGPARPDPAPAPDPTPAQPAPAPAPTPKPASILGQPAPHKTRTIDDENPYK